MIDVDVEYPICPYNQGRNAESQNVVDFRTLDRNLDNPSHAMSTRKGALCTALLQRHGTPVLRIRHRTPSIEHAHEQW